MNIRSSASLLALALVIAPLAARADDAPLAQPGKWAQDYTGRAADPSIRFGTLPNGLRYAIMHNETPKDGVAMRMRIGAGSIEERDDEQGLAHFLEHMAFRGSAHVADGEVVHMLERQGLSFGADTNAGTGHDETVYQFNFPRADPTALDTGLTLFREIGERLTIDPKAVDIERGVILSEERLRDVPPYEALKANLDNALAGTRAVERWPIGQVAIIKMATAGQIRRFYEANYRPDNATLVIVGNIDPRAVEAEVKARFADWRPHGQPDPLDAPAPAPAHQASEFAAPGVPDALSLAWVRPRDRRAETEAVDHEQVLQMIALAVLNNRLADRAGQPGSPFLRAGAASQPSVFGVAALTQIGITAAPDKWQEALAAVTQAERQIVTDGVSPDEIARAVAQTHTALDVAAAGAATRKSADIADTIVGVVNEDQLVTSPAQDLALFERFAPDTTPVSVGTALQQLFTSSTAQGGPVLFRSTQGTAAGAAALGTALTADYAAPLSHLAATAAIVWPYSDFGAAGAVVSRAEDRELGTTSVAFANGTRLIVKPTAFTKDQILVSVGFGQGRAGAPAALTHALWASQFMPFGGTGKLPLAQITRWAQTNNKVAGVAMSAGVNAFTLSGATRPADLPVQMQMLAGFARDPGFRPEMGEKLAAAEPMIAGQIAANAGAVFAREVQRQTAGGDARFAAYPSAAEIAETKPDDLPALLKDALAGPADVTIVGDVRADDAIAAVAATFGAGPAGPATAMVPVHIGMLLPGTPDIVTHAGRADQAYIGVYWPLPDYFADPKLAYVGDVAAAILSARLVDTVRETMGLTYSPQAEAVSSVELSGQGYFGAVIETPAANFATFRAALDAEVARLANAPVSADVLARAKLPLIEGRTKELETNPYWLGQLPLVLRDLRVKVPTLETAAGVRPVDAAAVQALFKRFIAGKPALVVEAKAAAAGEPAGR